MNKDTKYFFKSVIGTALLFCGVSLMTFNAGAAQVEYNDDEGSFEYVLPSKIIQESDSEQGTHENSLGIESHSQSSGRNYGEEIYSDEHFEKRYGDSNDFHFNSKDHRQPHFEHIFTDSHENWHIDVKELKKCNVSAVPLPAGLVLLGSAMGLWFGFGGSMRFAKKSSIQTA